MAPLTPRALLAIVLLLGAIICGSPAPVTATSRSSADSQQLARSQLRSAFSLLSSRLANTPHLFNDLRQSLAFQPSLLAARTATSASLRLHEAGSVASTPCLVAVSSLANLAQECGDTSIIFAPDADPTEVATFAARFCVSDCYADFPEAIALVNEQCTAADLGADFPFSAFNGALSAFRSVCLRDEADETKFCAPIAFTALRAIEAKMDAGSAGTDSGNMPELTDQELAGLCHPCMLRFLRALGADGVGGFGSGAELARTAEMVCERDGPSSYCYHNLRTSMMRFAEVNMDDDDAMAIWSDETKSPFPYLCTPCVKKLMSRSLAFQGTGMDSFSSAALQFLCVRDYHGRLCMSKMAAFAASQNAPPPQNMDGMCRQMRDILNQLGCCFGEMFKLLKVMTEGVDVLPPPGMEEENGIDLTEIFEQLAAQCKLKFPKEGCRAAAVIQGTLQLNNLRYSYWKTNRTLVESALKKDLASATGMFDEQVAITSVRASTPTDGNNPSNGPSPSPSSSAAGSTDGTSVSFEVDTDTKANSESAAAALRTAGSIPMTALSSLPMQSRVQIANGQEAQVSESQSVDTGYGNGSTTNLPTVCSLLAVAWSVLAMTVF